MGYYRFFSTLAAFALVGLPALAQGETHLLYFGGGGERSNAKNLFDRNLGTVIQTAAIKNWHAEYLTDPKHPSTKLVLAGR